MKHPEPPPEAQTEAEQIAYCAGWWAAMAWKGKEMTIEYFAKLVAEAEREECAKLAEEVGNKDSDNHAWDAAAAIRARG